MTDPGSFPALADFAGTWHIDRRIDDQLGPPGWFTGTARFEPVAGHFAYHEQGLLHLGDGPAFAAERRYFWRADGEEIAVDFADGRPFHRFDPSHPVVTAEHDCAPDFYRVSYDFADWPAWQAEWQVRGPRKNYGMVSAYRR